MKLLLVTLYWPPAGGGGVQRPLKFAQYLPALGIETHVLAPDDSKWIHEDADLRVPTQAWVHRARYLGPKGRKPAEELHGTEGLERALVQARLASRRLLVPDENVSWNLTAIPAAIRIARKEGIDVVVTTSPPNSIHLVGAAVKKATGATWVADLRDSLVAHPHRRSESMAVRAKEKVDHGVARLVAHSADAITCVSDAIAEEARGFSPQGKVVTISNGCDFDDFAGLDYTPGERFRITHTGSFFGKRDPRPFLTALDESGLDVQARFLGDFRSADREWAEERGLGDKLELIPYAPRQASLELQRDSEALLLLIPDAGGRGKGVLSGKVFEYLAAERPILAAVPPDGAAADLIRETGAGVVAPPDDVEALKAALAELHERFANGGLPATDIPEETRYRLSRRARAEELAELVRSPVTDPATAPGPGPSIDALFFATVFTVTFAKLQWEVAGTLSLSDVLTAVFLVALAGTRIGTGDRRLTWGAAVAALFFVALPRSSTWSGSSTSRPSRRSPSGRRGWSSSCSTSSSSSPGSRTSRGAAPASTGRRWRSSWAASSRTRSTGSSSSAPPRCSGSTSTSRCSRRSPAARARSTSTARSRARASSGRTRSRATRTTSGSSS